jgi:hypothetical protein
MMAIFAISLAPKKRSVEEKAYYYTNQVASVVAPDSTQYEKMLELNLWISRQFDSLNSSKPDELTRRKASSYLFKHRDSVYRSIFSKKQYLMYDDWQREQREIKRRQYDSREGSANKHVLLSALCYNLKKLMKFSRPKIKLIAKAKHLKDSVAGVFLFFQKRVSTTQIVSFLDILFFACKKLSLKI